MANPSQVESEKFDPAAYSTFRFLDRRIEAGGLVRLRYALDDVHEFEEQIELPMPAQGVDLDHPSIRGLLTLLHLTAGVSYYKMAIPPRVTFEGAPPAGPATVALLEGLYSEGLGEFAVVNGLDRLPRPRFAVEDGTDEQQRQARAADGDGGRTPQLSRVLVPVGGGKDSAVAIEIARRSEVEVGLFSVGDAKPIRETASAAALPRLTARRTIDPRLLELNAVGALNGHVPITAIVSAIALLTAALHGYDAVALANERSASAGNLDFDGVEVNHQFSKSLRAEQLLGEAVAEIAAAPAIFSVLRPASELSIARAFARFPKYHPVFTSCNRIFQLDPAKRLQSWCCDCDKCRFVFLILAPFSEPEQLRTIFGQAMLDDDAQYEGFALLTATGGHKPFECVGEVRDSVAAIRLLASQPRWSDQKVVARLTAEVLPRFAESDGRPADVFRLSDEHRVPRELLSAVDELLGG